MKFASKLFNKLKYLTMIVLVTTVVSCDSWLDLGSEDRIMENTLFSSQAGFMTALNGVYIELLNSSLYGGTLSYKTFDILAQYYDCDKDEQTKYLLIINSNNELFCEDQGRQNRRHRQRIDFEKYRILY